MIREQSPTSFVGLALAGGGPAGSIYEIGALRALDESLDGVDFNDVPIYVGVSAGAFIAACLANGISTDQLCRAIIKNDPGEHPFVPETFLTPDFYEFARGGLKIPRLLAKALWDYARNPGDLALLDSLMRLSYALPVGVFRNEPIRRYLRRVFTRPGRTDDFRELANKLVVVATDLDSGRPVRFGEPGLDHIPISTAVKASTALPGLYSPVEIEGRHYVDGVLLKTVHASVALEEGAALVLCVNPIVPVDTVRSVEAGVMRRGKLVNRGLITVMSQTFRTIIHSRMGVGLSTYAQRYPDRDVLVFEPRRDDYSMFFSNVFSFANRKAICEHAYHSTRRQLWRNRSRIGPLLERHGIRLRLEVLEESGRDLWLHVGMPTRRWNAPLPVVRRLADTLEQLAGALQHGS